MLQKNFLIFLSFFALLFYSCKSPLSEEIKKSAILQISVESEPLYANYDWEKYSYFINTTVIVTETNGVGCSIEKVEVILLTEAISPPNYHSYDGGRLNPYGTLRVPVNIYIDSAYEVFRVRIFGLDDNGHEISIRKNFSIEFIISVSCVYTEFISGKQNGIHLNTMTTFKINQ